MLLSLARQAIRCALNREHPEFVIPLERLRQPRGVFTTLSIDGKLRGCVGQPHLHWPGVADAVARAGNDSRRLRAARPGY